MAQIRAQVVLQGASGLPEDQFVNVLHFVTAGSYASDAVAVAAQLVTRYQALQGYLSRYVTGSAEIKTYDMSVQTLPRVPTVFPFTLTLQTTVVSLPLEVASCISFKGSPPNVGSRRGRIYIGPLNVSTSDNGSVTAPPRPHSGYVTQLAAFGSNLIDANLGWSIWSPTTGLFVTVLDGWADDEYDTMRSRGTEATARQLFS